MFGEKEMRLYHATSKDAASSILKHGFKNSMGNSLANVQWTGVWLSDKPLDVEDGLRADDALLIVEIDSDINNFEWKEEGKPYREFLVPAEIANSGRISLSSKV